MRLVKRISAETSSSQAYGNSNANIPSGSFQAYSDSEDSASNSTDYSTGYSTSDVSSSLTSTAGL